MTPADVEALLEMLERIAIALEKIEKTLTQAASEV